MPAAPIAGLRRLPDSAERFGRLLVERWTVPFAWGSNDCCLWAADAVLALLGVDPAARIRGTYHDAAGAGLALRRLGAGGLVRMATAVLGQPLCSPLLARVGDIGHTNSRTLAVCIGEQWTAPNERGLGLLPLTSATMAWRVGV